MGFTTCGVRGAGAWVNHKPLALGSCAPAHGPVQLVVLSKVQLLDSSNNIVAQYAELPLIPNNLIGFRVTEGPS